jgi:hypothetical protein
MDIEQKVAVITGASRGLGAALVKAYRDRGYGYHRGLGLKAGKVLPRRLAGFELPASNMRSLINRLVLSTARTPEVPR